MRRALPVLLAVLAATAAAIAVFDDDGDADGAGRALEGSVVRVVDGDTIHVRVGGRVEKVRYIGVDTPESVKPGTAVECFAKAAAAANSALVNGERVRLVTDVEARDRYQRLLAYVYRTDDGRFVNAELVEQGFARTLTIPPNVRFAERFAQLARTAREAQRGLWHACP